MTDSDYNVEDALTQEEYVKLKGLRAMYDDLVQEQRRIWSAVEEIFDLVTEVSDDASDYFELKDLAFDAMHEKGGLDSYLKKKGFEVEDKDLGDKE